MSVLPVPDTAITAEPPPASAPPEFRPVAPPERIASIDFVRGVALLGILVVNAGVFFAPIGTLFEPSQIVGMPTHDRVMHLIILTLFLGKFISTFSMLFGYGLTGQIEKAVTAGRSPGLFTVRRLGALALFGLAHALLLWYGDILFIYAMLGLCLLMTRWITTRDMVIVFTVLLIWAALLHAGLVTFVGLSPPPQARQTRALPVPDGAPPSLEAMFLSGFDPAAPVWIEAETQAYARGPWSDAMLFRAVSWLFSLIAIALVEGWKVVAMFAVGAWLWRVRFFDPEQAWLRWRVFRICLPTGLALEALAAVFFWSAGAIDRRFWALGGVIDSFAVCFLPLGYLSGLALLTDRLPDWVRAPVTSAGRMALTVYLMETVLATGLSYHWGLGLFGRFGVLAQTGIAVAIWVALALAAWLWLHAFRQGPMERLWRLIGYGR
jgi:uncharacterized protein